MGLSLFLMVLGLRVVSATPHGSAAAQREMPAARTTVPVPAQPPAERITPDEAKKLLKEFRKAQSAELKALDHRQKLEFKELKAAQAARQKEWERREKEARHQYFAAHPKGPDRRAYIKEFLDRRRAFLAMLVDERNNRSHEQIVRSNAVKQDQVSRLREFQEFLDRGERPPSRLWPTEG